MTETIMPQNWDESGRDARPPNVRHLRACLAVAEAGSITGAAEALHLTQPAITQGVRNIEERFGAELFRRTKTGVELTPAGEVMRRRLERAFELMEEALSLLARAAGAKSGARGDSLSLITTAQIEALISVSRYGSFAVAARASGLSQPTLHRAARDLERNIGVRLFEETSFGVKPTRAAEDFARRARLFFHEISQGVAEVAAITGREAGVTIIGAMPLARSHLVPTAVSKFTRERAGHLVSIVEAPYENLLIDLRRGVIDFLVGAMRENLPAPEVVQEPLFEDPLSIIMRSGHPLAKTKKIPPKRLSQYPWVAPRKGSPLRRHFNALFEGAGADLPKDLIECNSLSASRVLLMESDRLMLLSDAQTVFERKAGALVSRPHPLGRTARSIGLAYRRDWRPTEAQGVLLDLVRTCAKN
ncbi:MAG TPA: LysR family transcriptional regulator [Parvularculaceae bacterium]|nr:LysR family transcriptional regulator [Parvularculaceae bacterium]HRX39432.1 LysR family transcriptional regulator [Parvularculaceae bacterium]